MSNKTGLALCLCAVMWAFTTQTPATAATAAAGNTAAAPSTAAAAKPSTPSAQAPAPATAASGARAPGGTQRTRMACMAADRNHDGRISLEEFHQEVTRSWLALPQDATGHVVLVELATIPGMDRRALERLRQADRDNDGRLSVKEVVAARMAMFDAADADSSDSISIDECVAQERKMRARR